MQEQSASQQPTGGAMQKYLDRAVGVLTKFGILPAEDAPSELTKLLDEVKHVDEAKVLAIAKTVKYMSSFNAMVRENVENINIGNRYLEITQLFDSVREDSKNLIAQLDDGKVSIGEKIANLWMRIRRGSPHDRFEKIVEVYKGRRQRHQGPARPRADHHGWLHRFPLRAKGVGSHRSRPARAANSTARRRQEDARRRAREGQRLRRR